MMRTILGCTLLMIAIWPEIASGKPLLAQIRVEYWDLGLPPIPAEFVPGLTLYDFMPTDPLAAEWILGPLTPADIGITYIASAETVADYPLLEWDSIVDRLTNGNDDSIEFGIDDGELATNEANLFAGGLGTGDVLFVPWLNNVDLGGYQIHSIGWTLDDVRIEPNADPVDTVYLFYTVSIFAVPEPSALWLIVVGIVLWQPRSAMNSRR
jgi:hypothetical protein